MGVASAAPVSIPNSDFSASGNEGSIGGGVIGGSGTAMIGAGPWSGTYWGVLGLLAPPTLTIGGGNASFSGLLDINVLELLNNGGYFHQQLATPFLPDKRYTLSARVDRGSVLSLAALNNGNAGIALAAGSTRVSSSVTSSAVTLDLISGTAYRLKLVYDTSASVSGNIGIQLFNEPSGVLSAGLLNALSFDDITLDVRAINQVPASIGAANGSGSREAVVGMPITPTLGVRVVDTDGDPIEGLAVTYSAPATGASVVLASTTATTGADGVASVDATANTVAGSYEIKVSVVGLPNPLIFDVINRAGQPANVVVVDGGGGGGGGGDAANQATVINSPFALPLTVEVVDSFGNAVSDVGVTFSAPASGASASLAPASVTTGANGQASSGATANGTIGSYIVNGAVSGVSATAVFNLTNLLDPGVGTDPGGGAPQTGAIEGLFSCALLARVTDADGEPLEGLEVEFVAPASGASAMLSDGVNSGLALRVTTDVDGFAWVEATSNDIEGTFLVTAQLLYSLSPAIEFPLTNLGANDPVYVNGFDSSCVPAMGPLDVDDTVVE